MNTRNIIVKLAERDLEILENAIDAFRRETKLRVKQGRRTETDLPDKATLEIEGPNRAVEYLVEIKPFITEATIGSLALQFADTPGRWIVVTRHVPSTLARRMKELHIQFLDTAGNAYISKNPFLVFVHGNKPVERFPRQTDHRTWGRAEIQTIFALLCKKDLVHAPYRNIAAGANVSLGTLARVFDGLAQQGYLLERGTRGRRLQRKKELLDKWSEAYAVRLRPKLLNGLFTTDKTGFWEKADLTPYRACWGGEVAANKITHYLQPEIVTIYANKPLNDLVLNFRFHRNAQGNVEIRERFWRFETEGQTKGLVPPILVYADLLATGNSRNVETAKMIFETHIERHLIED